MVHNCNFNKTALLVNLRRMIWRLETYKKDADTADHPLCKEVLNELEADLKKHSVKLQKAIVGLAKEDKFGFCDDC